MHDIVMPILFILGTACFRVFALGAERGNADLLRVKYALLSNPRSAVEKFCSAEDTGENAACRVTLSWRSRGIWTSVCDGALPARFGPRYFLLGLRCGTLPTVEVLVLR